MHREEREEFGLDSTALEKSCDLSWRDLPPELKRIEDKIAKGDRLNQEEALALFDRRFGIHRLGFWAFQQRLKRWGKVTFYAVNAHINPTNVCLYRCSICAYHRSPKDPQAFTLGFEEILALAAEASQSGCTEIHIVGGLHPEKPYQWYREIIRKIHEAFPRMAIKAWSAVEIAHFAKISGRTVAAILEDLQAVGLKCLPGGGAEIFHTDIRRQIAPTKADAETWLEVHRAAPRLGIPSNATILYGHIEEPWHRVEHLLRLRQLQDETGGFQAFVPLPFHPAGTKFSHLKRVSVLEDLRMIAASRLILDNFPHIKAYWVSLGIPIAQIALQYGADDIDGTVHQEKIFHQAGATTPQILSVEKLHRLIRELGQEPVERDALYRPVHRQGNLWWVEESPVESHFRRPSSVPLEGGTTETA
jgi:aminodeoxyfutalosine synthase